MPPAAVVEGYRRTAFNIMAVNQDDHVKNLSFHMDTDGTWRLTPAYDVTFAQGGQWTASHQMRVADKRSGITRTDLLSLARDFGIRAPKNLLGRIRDVLDRWPEYARQTGVPDEASRRIGDALVARREQMG
jgi:serine/threonine-protein kinase HipA